jgi:DNA modification methylase
MTLLHGDAATVLRTLEPRSVHCCVTSPPYFGLRDYGTPGQLGQESTVDEYVAAVVGVMGEVRRVLRDDGTLWLNLGDTYSACGSKTAGLQVESNAGRRSRRVGKAKQLLGIPWRVALAMQADGWILRSDVIWHKPNPMPESVRDRPTKSHEYVFLFAKQSKYYYDGEAVKQESVTRDRDAEPKGSFAGKNPAAFRAVMSRRQLRDVWTIASQPYKGAHFAVFPPKLVTPCIAAGTSEHGCCGYCLAPYKRQVERIRVPTRPGTADSYKTTDPRRHVTETRTTGWRATCDCTLGDLRPCTVLDPFCGSGTVGLVCRQLGRDFIGIDSNQEYLNLATERIAKAA